MTEQLQEFYPSQIWAKAKEHIRGELSDEIFASWFKNIECQGGGDDVVTLSAESDFAAMWIKDNYSDLLEKNLSLVCGRNIKAKVVAPAQSEDNTAAQAARQRAIRPSAETQQLRINTPISARNTFENFVVGESNQFAYTAALAVAQNLGVAFNPLFIYGPTGLGKTHLMQAVAHFVLKNNPEKRIVYLSSEAFVNDFLAALKTGNISGFRKSCRQADVLLIDDVQFLAKKEASQTEFFHTFNELFNAGKQIVLSCDRPINEVAAMEERLVTRFSWGAPIDIQPPDYETRLAILQKKIEVAKDDISISPEALDFVARRFTKNVRRMEGALTKLVGYATLINRGTQISLEKAQELLSDVLYEEDESQLVDVEKIQKRTAEYYRVDVEQICGKTRVENVVKARQVAMFLSRELTKLSLEEIGKRFGGKNHATVIHARKTVEEMIKQDENVRREVEYLQKTLSA